MKTVHIAEQYCRQCRREVGMEYATYSDGKRERRCLSRFCEQELTPMSVCHLTGERIARKGERRLIRTQAPVYPVMHFEKGAVNQYSI